MNARNDLDWSALNQQLLVAEFAHLRALLGEGDRDTTGGEVDAMRALVPGGSAIDTIRDLFQLSDFERCTLLLAAGVEMDSRLAALCGEATGQPHNPWATFSLALAALPGAHWSALSPVGPLRRWRMIEIDEHKGLTTGRLRLEERVLHFIGGLNYLDHRLRPLLRAVPQAGLVAQPHAQQAEDLMQQLAHGKGRLPIVRLTGDDPDAQWDVAWRVADHLGLGLYRLAAAHIPDNPAEHASLVDLWQREAALLGAGLVVSCPDPGDEKAARFVASIDGLVFLTGATLPVLDVDTLSHSINKLEAPEQKALWQTALAEHATRLSDTIDTLACQHRLSARRIEQLAKQLATTAGEDDSTSLLRLCRGDDASLGSLAQAIQPKASWSDLVLPESQRQTLQQLAVHTRHRLTVHHDWGFADKGNRGLGIATLFSGESGTGKTLAAEVLAHTLGLALYRIDLSAVISKYIGETEKNLRKVFDAAEDLGAILLFDEADALFGKRSEVKDSHDRYANIEVSYLLQRMEAYRGLAILTTNHKAALDTAFTRRLRFVVHFPFPDAAQREAIWRTAFPPQTPCETLDYTKLARLNATGGNIRNIALSAAFLAAEEASKVSMTHLLRAAHLEAAKQEKSPSDAETRGWV
jgi:hypothetical protein